MLRSTSTTRSGVSALGDASSVLCHSLNCSHLYLGVLSVVSKEDGSFRLENMTAGTYTIRVNKELMFFEPVTVKIAPSTPQLPDIVTAGYGRRFRSSLHKFRSVAVLDVPDVGPTQVQRMWPDLRQSPARGHEAAGSLQGQSDAQEPGQGFHPDRRLGPSGGLLLPGQTRRLQRPCKTLATCVIFMDSY